MHIGTRYILMLLLFLSCKKKENTFTKDKFIFVNEKIGISSQKIYLREIDSVEDYYDSIPYLYSVNSSFELSLNESTKGAHEIFFKKKNLGYKWKSFAYNSKYQDTLPLNFKEYKWYIIDGLKDGATDYFFYGYFVDGEIRFFEKRINLSPF